MKRQNGQFFSFGGFRLDVETRRLTQNENEIHLTPKAFKVLHLLVRSHDRVVTRDELVDEVWDGAFIEEGNINFNISVLRKTLQQGAGNGQKFIETVPRKGYRFVAKVVAERWPDDRNESDKEVLLADNRQEHLPRWAIVIVGLLSVSLLTSFSVYWRFRSETGLAPVAVNSRNIQSIAILPLRTIDGGDDAETLSVAIADTLVTRIGSLNRFAVRPLAAAQNAYSQGSDPIAAGEQLRVDAVLEGILIEETGRYRASLRLIDVRDGAQFWSGTFDVDKADLFQVLDAVSTDVARNLIDFLSATDEAMLVRQPTSNRDAYEQYLKGLYIWNRREVRTGASSPIVYLKKAVELDPHFAAAYVALADSYAFTPDVHLAEEALERAIAIDDSVVGANATKGFIRMFHYWDWAGAEEAFRNAIAKDPNDPKSHHWYGVLLAFNRRIGEAKTEMEIAKQLDPTSLIIMSDLAQLSYFEGDVDSAVQQLERVLSLDPKFYRANDYMFKVMLLKGDEDRAFSALRMTRNYDPSSLAAATRAFERAGLDGVFRLDLKMRDCEAFDKLNSYFCAEVLHAIGRDSAALDHLEFCVRERAFFSPYLKIDPFWNSLRTNERFSTLIGRIS